MSKDGGPAFPCLNREMQGSMDGRHYHYLAEGGMSLRDYIAIKMLPALYTEASKHNNISRADVIGEALAFADDYLLKAREP